jgi:hypothetical protein
MPPGYRWRVWIRAEHDREWLEPVIAGPDANVGWDTKEDAEMIAEGFRDLASFEADVQVLPEGQHPDDAL